jgi:hypothetical protein
MFTLIFCILYAKLLSAAKRLELEVCVRHQREDHGIARKAYANLSAQRQQNPAQQTSDTNAANVQFWEQATNSHSDLNHKSGPLSGPFLIKRQGVSIYNCMGKLCE